MKATLLLLCICSLSNAFAQQPLVKPGWPAARPEECGLSSAELSGLFNYVQQHKTRVHSVQVLRQGKLVLDAYFYPYNSGWRHDVASVTKSITSTLAGIAIDKGYIPSVKSNFYTYFPEYNIDSLKKQITLEDLLTMRSGLDCGTNMADPGINYDQRLEQVRSCPDWLRCIFDIPVAAKPGEHFAYCNVNCHILSAIIQRSSGLNAAAFARQHLFSPLGITQVYWPEDNKGINYGWGDLQLHPYDMLRIGQLMLQNGQWKEQQLISGKWLQQAAKAHVTGTGNNDRYGYYWWLPGPAYPGVFEAIGRGGQRITIWPAQQMVIVFTGGNFNPSDLVSFIIEAIKSDQPVPANAIAYQQLQAHIRHAATPPPVTANLSTTAPAAGISGKRYKMEQNSMAWDTIGLNIHNKREADLYLKWAGRDVQCTMGLDGIMRFSDNPITRLSQGCTGTWVNPHTLRVELDLVGAINLYNFDLVFSGDASTVEISLSEGTGLNKAKFTGTRIP